MGVDVHTGTMIQELAMAHPYGPLGYGRKNPLRVNHGHERICKSNEGSANSWFHNVCMGVWPGNGKSRHSLSMPTHTRL